MRSSDLTRMQVMIDEQIARGLAREMEDALAQENERQNPQPDSHLGLCANMDESSASSSSYSAKGPGIPYYAGEMPTLNPLIIPASPDAYPPAPKKPAPKLKKPPPILPKHMQIKLGKYGRIFPPKRN